MLPLRSLLAVLVICFTGCEATVEGPGPSDANAKADVGHAPLVDGAVQPGLDAATASSDGSTSGADASKRLDASHLSDAGSTPVDASHAGPDASVAGEDASTGTVDDAVIVSADLPATLACGATYDGAVVVKNAGTTTWTRAGGYKLGAVGDSDPFYGPDTRVWLPDLASVPPGASYTFHIPMTAPAQPGSDLTDWQMVHEGVRWFGQVASQTVQVQCTFDLVDATTLDRKLLMGYQGWFYCPGDGSPINHWVHWFDGSGHPTVDLWPDTRELEPLERCDSGYTLPDGSPAYLYSAWNSATVARHFRWMSDNHLDGVLLQRFVSELGDPNFFAARNQVTQNARAGAEATGRVLAIEYDISGASATTFVSDLESDWTWLVKTLGLTASPRYLHHKGRPLVVVWGFGFSDRPGNQAQAAALVDFFHNNADPDLRATVIAGVPWGWRDDASWAPTMRTFDGINPWTVGSYNTDADVDNYKKRLSADLADCQSHGVDFMPVIWPGFSWHNLKGDPQNSFPRRGGALYWRQVYDAVGAGVNMIFGAMFDEVDEGTAINKVAETAAQLPTQASFVPLDVDGISIHSDFYLRLADQAGKALRGEIALTPQVPITP